MAAFDPERWAMRLRVPGEPWFDAVELYGMKLADRPGLTDESLALLSDTEVARAARFRSPTAHHAFVVMRALLRALVSRRMGVAARDVSLAIGRHGKPHIVDCPLEVNLTHADGLGVVALAPRPVGVDCERVRPIPDLATLMRGTFSSSEREAVEGPSARPSSERFLQLWTLKEAVAKAVGTGLGSAAWTTELQLRDAAQVVHAPAATVCVSAIALPAGWCGAVAVAAPSR